MSSQTPRLAARGFAEANLQALSSDVVYWKRNSRLPENNKIDELARLCLGYYPEGDEYQEAQRLVENAALAYAAKPTSHSALQTEVLDAKLVDLLRTIPQLSQRQDSLHDQLKDLRVIANRLGQYDAADALSKLIGNLV